MTDVRGGRGTISVVLPCLNERDSIALCVKEALDAMSAAGLEGEVVVVDNGSTDGSARIAAEAGARIVLEPVPGYGSALRTGIAAATGEIVVMADADYTYPLSRIPELVAPVADGTADLVLGSRLEGLKRESMPLLHRFAGTPVLSFLISRTLGGRTVKDSQSGFRAFRRDRILELGLRSTGMEFASEMLIRSAQQDWRIAEISTGYRPRIGESKLNTFADGWRHLQLILLLAPHLFLVGPGAALLLLGLGLSVWAFFSPAGVDLGSLRWQPVFFSSIAIVLGTQAVFVGSLLAYHSSVLSERVRRPFRFVGRPTFAAACMAGGLAAVIAGLALDLGLFVVWISDGPTPARGPAAASLAQSLIIVGSSVASFGFLRRLTSLTVARDFERMSHDRDEATGAS